MSVCVGRFREIRKEDLDEFHVFKTFFSLPDTTIAKYSRHA